MPGGETYQVIFRKHLKRLALAFRKRVAVPTEVQVATWNRASLHSDNALLVAAPTGTGKTWAALIPLLAHWLAQRECGPAIRQAGPFGLWICPLRALATDLGKRLPPLIENLSREIPEIAQVGVAVRTSDTPLNQRAKQKASPPDIWVGTPESLAIWLCQPPFRNILASTRVVVVDEVHALAVSGRGADLALSLERLEETAGEPLARMGLSATCKPEKVAGRFLAGSRRKFEIISTPDLSELNLTIEYLPQVGFGGVGDALSKRLKMELNHHQTILVFTRTRSTAERLVRRLRDSLPGLVDQIGIHHGSLTTDHRRKTESDLRLGHLRVVVASSSLELGMDIGSVGLVILVHPPGEAVRLLQRVGRSGRGPGKPRLGLILAGNPADLLQAAVTARAGRTKHLEPLLLASPAMDALCQHLVSEASNGPVVPAHFLAMARRSAIYSKLKKELFNQCLNYLTGELGGTRRISARLLRTPEGFILAGGKIRFKLRSWLGTIPPSEVRSVHLLQGDSKRSLGEVDPGFADQLKVGDRFLLEGRSLEVRSTENGPLEVEEKSGGAGTPRWGGGLLPLSPLLARRLHQLNKKASSLTREKSGCFESYLFRNFHLGATETKILAHYFLHQESISEIPTPAFVLSEWIREEGEWMVCLHTPLPRAGNDALSRVISLRLAKAFPGFATLPGIVADLGLSFRIRELPEKPAQWLRELLSPNGFQKDFLEVFSGSPLVRRRFQELAVSGLMLLPPSREKFKSGLASRPKVGGNTWAARRLFNQVRRLDPNFPLMQQAIFEAQKGFCDQESANSWLLQATSLPIRVRFLATVSPFCRHWLQRTNAEQPVELQPDSILKELANRIQNPLGPKA